MGLADLWSLQSERDFFQALPPLVKVHGNAAVTEHLKTYLTQTQITECFKRLQVRQESIVWLHCSTNVAGVLEELALLVTDRSLNEVHRESWRPADAPNIQTLADAIVNGFLREV